MSQAPKMSIVQEQKAHVDGLLTNKIQEMMDKGVTTTEAIQELYEEVKGKGFREEQALAKILYREELQNNLNVVNHEISALYPSLAKIINTKKESANVDKFLLTA